MSDTVECPPAEQLLDFASGQLSDDSQAAVEAHIDGCSTCRASLSALAKKDPMPNTTFGRYKIERVLGAGGMGIVYRAWDPQLARPVAIKVVKQASSDAQLRTRLVREAQSLARLSHPNVCHVYDVGTEDDEVWVAMELIEGDTLRAWALQRRTHEQLLATLLGAAEGIAAAHASGLIHRDIKPENVLVTPQGRPVVMDFGLARLDLPVDPNASTMSGDPLMTATGAIVGTPAYLAPEQLTGDPLDARVDQFAWATMAWELLTGLRPFPIVAAIRLEAVRAGLTPPATLPRPIATALIRAMSLSPSDRFASMRELIDAIRVQPSLWRSRLPVVAGAAAIAIGGTIVAWQTMRDDDPEPAPPIAAPITPDAAVLVETPPPAPDAAAIDAGVAIVETPVPPKATPKRPPDAGTQVAAAPQPQPQPSQPPLRPLNNPKYRVSGAYSTMAHYCRVPMDVKRPDPKLGKYGIVDWGSVVRREKVIATLADRESYMEMYEVRGARETYKFDAEVGPGYFGELDVPIGQLVALCVDPSRPEKSTIYKLPPPWDGGQDLVASVIPLKAAPALDAMKSFAPLHISDNELRRSADRSTLTMQPSAHYLVRAKVDAKDGGLWKSDDWWLEVPQVKGAEHVAAGKLLWFVITPPRFEPADDGGKPRMIAKAVLVLDEIFPH